MTLASEPIERAASTVRGAVAEQADAYAHGERRPLGGYLVLLSVYASILAALGALVRRRGTLPDRFGAADLALLSIGTHKLSRLVTKDSVTAVLRAPFTTYVEPSGEGEVREEVRGDGLRHAAGELVTCPFCIAVWIATGLAFGLVLAPRATRLVASILTAVTASDYLQMAYAVSQRAVHEG
jgi:hypothetical protein